jgi:hypothetical protein
MNPLRTALLATLALLAAAPVALAAGTHAAPVLGVSVNVDAPSVVGLSETAYVPKGQVHEGDLVSILGDVKVDGEVTGSIVVVMGSLELNGRAHEDVVSVMSRTHIGSTAQVGGEFVNVGWTPMRDEGSTVAGEVVNVNFMNLVPFAGHGGGIGGILRFLLIWHLIKLAGLFIILLLITALIPRRLATMAAQFPTRWSWSFLVGLLTYAGVFIGVLFLAITLIGIPLALVLWFTAKMLKWVGLAAIFYLMGNSMGKNLARRDLPHLASVLGGFVLYAIISLVPLIGMMFSMALSILALGLVLTTRFGAEPIVVPSPVAPSPQPPPVPQPPPIAPMPATGEPPRAW